ncbi:RimJ/RimL family protein N-acetyltransferase [Hamadaea flava]|uniref:GNAT family N-acetyltransferase n=1 Tax=Hamadaea flava TaxID=1742688 RepID=A0ABV8M3G6_9ACTN|nr:GNAT family N-acetyltransferase [Hamadaea flava]MCP2328622.1 RimJ/RimL family protein N-acetyltransferase [Hamadaea flava]
MPDLISVTDPADPHLDQIAELLVAAVRRREAIGLPADVTPEYARNWLLKLLPAVRANDAGLIAAVVDGEVAGTAKWQRSEWATRWVHGDLDKLTVAPSHRGSGVGRALVEAVAADASAHGVELLTLSVRGNNHGAIALYEGCGFRRTGWLENAVADGDARHDVVLMARELARPATARLLGSWPAGAGASLARGVTEGATWWRTDRLLLCRPTAADAAEHFAIHADPATNVHNPAGPQTDRAESEQTLGAWAFQWAKSGFGYWTVRLAETGEVIGFGGVRPALPGEDGLNLYYRFTPAAWGHGYAQELGRAALELARRRAPGEPVLALIRPENAASIRVAERLGLTLDGPVERELGTYLRYVIRPA